MIFDTFENMGYYSGINKNVTDILEAIKGMTAEGFTQDKIMLNGEKSLINRNEYRTHSREQAQMEAHGRYIDVMAVLEGEETVYVYPASRLKSVTASYNEEKDFLLASFEEEAVPVHLKKGMFLVLFPGDAHAPGCDAAGGANVKKLVGKALL